MRKTLISFCVMFMLLASLSACSATLSNKRLTEDILSLDGAHLMNKVNDMTIIEKTQDSSHINYKISATLNSYNFTATADIILSYIKTDGKWVLSQNTINIVKTIPKNDPTLISAVDKVLAKLSDEILDQDFIGGTSQRFKLDSLNSDKDNGVATMIVSESFDDGIFSMDATYQVTATYEMVEGWTYTVTDWIYHESTDWAGTYDIVFTKNVPGYPMEALNAFYTLGTDVHDVVMTGSVSITKQMNKPDVLSGGIHVSFSYEGIRLTSDGAFYSSTSNFILSQEDYHDALLIFDYTPIEANNVYGLPNHYSVGTPALECDITKQP